MNQSYGINPFDDAKTRISESAHKLHQYLIAATIVGILFVIILAITIFAVIGSIGFNFEDLNPNDIYASIETFFATGIFTLGTVAIVLVVFLIIALVALLIVMILSYVQYYKLGSSFSKLHAADPMMESAKYISYGFFGYVIALIASIAIPNVTGSAVISIIGNIVLAIAAYLIYQLFNEYSAKARFNAKPSYLLFAGLAINAVTSIVSIFNTYGYTGSLIGYILMLIGFKHLSRDIKLVSPPGGQVVQQQAAPVSYAPAAPMPVDGVKAQPPAQKFCSNCGTGIATDVKFCSNCGANV